MARPYRLEAEETCYHITSRGNERKAIFTKDRDREKFLEYLQKAKEKYKFYLYAYVLMTNHYHLLLETKLPNISRIMQYINTSYTTYYNVKYKRSGHLFQGRYKSIVVDKESYFLELSRYIHLNPVRAKMVSRPQEYAWSSYQGYISKSGDGRIDKERVNELTEMNGSACARFTEEGITDKIEPFKNLYAGFILGKTSFIKEKLNELKDQVEGEISFKDELRAEANGEAIIKAVEDKYGKSLEEIKESKRRPMREKQVLVYLLRRMTGLTNAEIGEMLGLKFSAVSKAGIKLEDEMGSDKGLRREVEELASRFEG